jgi:hypothetical protein
MWSLQLFTPGMKLNRKHNVIEDRKRRVRVKGKGERGPWEKERTEPNTHKQSRSYTTSPSTVHSRVQAPSPPRLHPPLPSAFRDRHHRALFPSALVPPSTYSAFSHRPAPYASVPTPYGPAVVHTPVPCNGRPRRQRRDVRRRAERAEPSVGLLERGDEHGGRYGRGVWIAIAVGGLREGRGGGVVG